MFTETRQQIAATSLFLATKVEETCRKIKELVIACCRVAQKNPHLLVDEQTKDFWRWRDTILYNEDVLLEVLCFDLTIESPYRILADLIKHYHASHNKRLRDSAWSFINDSNMTQLCLLFTSRTIACAALYCGAKHANIAFEDEQARPWWEVQQTTLLDIRQACNYMANFYISASGGLKMGSDSMYMNLLSPTDGSESEHRTRLKRSQTPMTPVKIERSGSEMSLKRSRHEDDEEQKERENGREKGEAVTNGHPPLPDISVQPAAQGADGRTVKKMKIEDVPGAAARPQNGTKEDEDDAGSEEGEVEE